MTWNNDSKLQWQLKDDVRLYDWQKRAIAAFPEDNKGVAKIVTGAGKTLFAIALFVKHQNKSEGRFRVLVVVPTKVLQDQWVREIIRWTNIPLSAIGLIGDGKSDSAVEKEILIAVVNSAVKKIDEINTAPNGASGVFMILDECHRYVGRCHSRIFEIETCAVLGLSATPNEASFGPLEIMGRSRRIGKLFYELSYKEAVESKCLSEFELVHVGFDLSNQSREHYENMSAEMDKHRHSESKSVLHCVSERWKGLYNDPERDEYAIGMLADLLKRNPTSRILAFHERISCIDRFVSSLAKIGIEAVAVHSKRNDKDNRQSIRAFESGMAQVLVAGKSLMEGFDIPAADVGLIISATTSPVRAIQTIGRVLRKNGDLKEAVIYRLFARNTVEEKIFKRADFLGNVGANRNRFCRCVRQDDGTLLLKDEAQLCDPICEEGIKWDQLQTGEIVNCRPEGFYFSEAKYDEFLVSRDGKRYLVLNTDEMKELYSQNSFLRFRRWYFCTDAGHILERELGDRNDYNRWQYCGDLTKEFVIRVLQIESESKE